MWIFNYNGLRLIKLACLSRLHTMDTRLGNLFYLFEDLLLIIFFLQSIFLKCHQIFIHAMSVLCSTCCIIFFSHNYILLLSIQFFWWATKNEINLRFNKRSFKNCQTKKLFKFKYIVFDQNIFCFHIVARIIQKHNQTWHNKFCKHIDLYVFYLNRLLFTIIHVVMSTLFFYDHLLVQILLHMNCVLNDLTSSE